MESESTLVFAADHPVFAGHFPGAPIVPGVLLLDAALHALAEEAGRPVAEVASAKFLQPVAPGQVLTLWCSWGQPGRCDFAILRDGLRAATGQLRLSHAG